MVNFDSRVFAEGIPRQGASVAAAPIRFDKDGYQESNDLFSLASTDQIRESKSRLSDESGFVRSAASCRDSMAEHESVGVAAYHPRYGSAYRELTLKELKEADDIELHLERGRAVSGQIVDEDSLPIENAVVRLSTSWKKGSISLDGLTGHTDVEGNYFIAGITGEANTVYGLTVREYENGRVQARASAPISSEMYNPQTRTWEVPPLIVRRTDGEPDRSSK